MDHSIGHIPFGSLEGDKRPDKINQNPESLDMFCPKQENNVKIFIYILFISSLTEITNI